MFNKINKYFDRYASHICIIGLTTLSLILIVERSNSFSVTEDTRLSNIITSDDETVRAKFYKCILNPKCKVSKIKIESIKKNAKRKLIPPVSKTKI